MTVEPYLSLDGISLTKLPTTLRKRIEETVPPYEDPLCHVTEADGPCWSWIGGKNKDGYGQCKFRAKVWNTHRLVWHLLVEKLDQPGKARQRDGRILDHRCHHRPCCNPLHLEHISQSDNVKRGARHS